MLSHIAVHGLFDLKIIASGDLNIDTHHTIEDTAIVLGAAFDQCLGDRMGIVRAASCYMPMDESLAFVAVDISGRSYTEFEAEWTSSRIGVFPTSMVQHFFESFAIAIKINLHARVLYGRDDHHKAEALFKAMGRSLDSATLLDSRRRTTIPSTNMRMRPN